MKALLIAIVFFAGVAMLHCQIQTGQYFIQSAKDQGTWDICGAPNCFPADTDLFTFTFDGLNSQQLTVNNLGNGFYTFTKPQYNFAVAYAQSTNPDATLFLTQYNPADTTQQFSLVARSDGTYLIKPRNLPNLAMKSPPVGLYAQIFLDARNCNALDERFNFVPYAPAAALKASKVSQSEAVNG